MDQFSAQTDQLKSTFVTARNERKAALDVITG